MPPSPRNDGLLRRSWPWLVAATSYTALACLFLWPLVRAADRVVITPGDDSLLNSWILWWNVQAVPLTETWWNAPVFYPARGAMAFSELLLGELPLTAPVQWLTGNPALAHNVAIILSFPLCALSMHTLVFHLTRRHDGAVLAGLAFGFGAFRANHVGHLQLLSVYWVAIALLCLHRSLDAARPIRWLAGATAACGLQVLCNGYTLFQLPLLIVAWILWFPRTLRQRVAAFGALAVSLVALAPMLLGYRRIHAVYGMSRSYEAMRDLSADIITLFQPHVANVLLGPYSRTVHPAWFPGITVTVLLITAAACAARWRTPVSPYRPWYRTVLLVGAIVAGAVAISYATFGPWVLGPLTVSQLFKPLNLAMLAACCYLATAVRTRHVVRARSTTVFYAVASILFFVLSFGPEPRFMGERVMYKSPYMLLLQLPGYDAIRAPDRMALFGTFCLVVVMALGYARWAHLLKTRRAIVWGMLCAGLIVDGRFHALVEPLPAPGPRVNWQETRAVVELPLLLVTDVSAMYRSIEYGVPSINAGSGYWPQHYHILRDALAEADLTVLEGLDVGGPVAAAIDRASPDYDRLVQAAAAIEGATLLQQSAAWTVYQLPQPVPKAQVLGPALPLTRVVREGTRDHITEVVAELREPARASAVHMRLDTVWAVFAREVTIETSMDGATWLLAGQQLTSAAVARGLLRSPRMAAFVMTFEPRLTRFVRVRSTMPENTRTLTMDGLSIH